jgi:hypothetical protein
MDGSGKSNSGGAESAPPRYQFLLFSAKGAFSLIACGNASGKRGMPTQR